MEKNLKKYIAEALGTMILVFFGCGTAVITNGSIIPTALAFGLAIVAAAYAIGDISGCHVNPAVSLAMLITQKMSVKDFCGYILGQMVGAFAGTGLLYAVLYSTDIGTANLGANSFASGDLNLTACGAFLVEIVLTFVFVYTILGVTSDKEKKNIAPIVIGLTLCFVHLIGIKLTGTSVNPIRSIAPAIVSGGNAVKQLWIFAVAPCVGAALSACTYTLLNGKKK
jgi:aquaporin Z